MGCLHKTMFSTLKVAADMSTCSKFYLIVGCMFLGRHCESIERNLPMAYVGHNPVPRLLSPWLRLWVLQIDLVPGTSPDQSRHLEEGASGLLHGVIAERLEASNVQTINTRILAAAEPG